MCKAKQLCNWRVWNRDKIPNSRTEATDYFSSRSLKVTSSKISCEQPIAEYFHRGCTIGYAANININYSPSKDTWISLQLHTQAFKKQIIDCFLKVYFFNTTNYIWNVQYFLTGLQQVNAKHIFCFLNGINEISLAVYVDFFINPVNTLLVVTN